jgi:hypothetical protein
VAGIIDPAAGKMFPGIEYSKERIGIDCDGTLSTRLVPVTDTYNVQYRNKTRHKSMF